MSSFKFFENLNPFQFLGYQLTLRFTRGPNAQREDRRVEPLVMFHFSLSQTCAVFES